jgi:hypothetical protein
LIVVTDEPVASAPAAQVGTEAVTTVDREAHAAGFRTDPTPLEVILKIEFAAVVTRGVKATADEPPTIALPVVAPLPDDACVSWAPPTVIIIAVTFAS